MNYFRCTVGGSGKGNTVTVTCAEEFAGLTITLSKTGKTYTKTCPSTSPYVVTFNGVENGTYTVSCTVDGQTYSETVIVQDISCVLNYGFNWKLWVDTASQLDSSDYDSLDEVLADEEALRELFLEHACVDYMASVVASNEDLETVINDDYCAKWINNSDYALDYLYANEVIADLMDEADKYFYGEWVITDSTTTPPTWGPKGNVPVMTSATAPYGTVVSNLTDGYKAFDGNDSTVTQASTENIYPYVEYDFTNPICLKKVFVKARATTAAPSAFACKIQYYDESLAAWSDLASFNVDISSSAQDYNINTSSNDKYALKLRMYSTTQKKSGYGIVISTLQFYGRALKVSVPVMTSNTAPYGTVNASSVNSSNYAWYAFDNSTNSWQGAARENVWLSYSFVSPVIIKKFSMKAANLSGTIRIKNFKLQASNDSFSTVVDLGTYLNPADNNTHDYVCENSTAYSECRIYIIDNYAVNGYSAIEELQFYGLDYSEKEFEVGTTKKWLYDHGVELEPLVEWKSASTMGIEKRDNSILMSKTTDATGMIGRTIDLSPYSLARLRLGDKGASINQYNGLFVRSNEQSGGTTISAYRFTANTYFPNNIGLDVSSNNASYYYGVGVLAGGTQYLEFTELWLE